MFYDSEGKREKLRTEGSPPAKDEYRLGKLDDYESIRIRAAGLRR
jgi:hypothetical protein